jgi:ubiquinone/menaquinone biosynthesis C-methylase UbiE
MCQLPAAGPQRHRRIQQRYAPAAGSWHYGRVNRIHNLICSSGWWSRAVDRELLPWALEGVRLGDDVLEFGPGFGATTEVLARQCSKLHVLELERGYCERLRSKLGDRVVVTQGDATKMPFEDQRFSAVVCFTMLHHIPSRELQERALAEAARVLRPGGVFAGSDRVEGGVLFRAIHVGDTLNLVDPGTFGSRLIAAGLAQPQVDTAKRSFRWRAFRGG